MRLYHLTIERFRGIRQLDWTIRGQRICLIGPGDSCKSTILDAIEMVLSPKWNIQVSDTDFFDCATAQPIIIRATVGELPEEVIREQRFGLAKRGWHPVEGLHDEPEDRDEDVLTLQLKVDESLEPVWSVVNDRQPEPDTDIRP